MRLSRGAGGAGDELMVVEVKAPYRKSCRELTVDRLRRYKRLPTGNKPFELKLAGPDGGRDETSKISIPHPASPAYWLPLQMNAYLASARTAALVTWVPTKSKRGATS